MPNCISWSSSINPYLWIHPPAFIAFWLVELDKRTWFLNVYKWSSMQVSTSSKTCGRPIQYEVGWGHLTNVRSALGLPVQRSAMHLILLMKQRRLEQEENTFNQVMSLRDPTYFNCFVKTSQGTGCSWAILITPAPCGNPDTYLEFFQRALLNQAIVLITEQLYTQPRLKHPSCHDHWIFC